VDDFHQTFAGGPLGIGLGINYDYVNVDPLTTDVAADQAAILSALRAGRFIAVHGFDDPNTLPILTISGNTITAASQGANIVCEWSGAAGTTAGWTGVIASQRLTQLLEPAQTNVSNCSYTIQGNEGYLRLRVSEFATPTKQVWYQPFRIERAAQRPGGERGRE
jgi:hypothetical protein